MKKFEYSCDMGSIKILFENAGSCFFNNNIGDIEAMVFIFEDEKEFQDFTLKKRIKTDFLEHFTSFGTAYLMAYDCDNEQKLYNFAEARWFVELDKEGNFYIYLRDADIHA